jgi:hypothetical protein
MKYFPLIAAAIIAIGADAPEKPRYSFKGEAFEACECQSVCPCVWTKDASFGSCRGTLAWTVSEGAYGKTDLKGLVFALTLTRTAENMVKSMGKWEGVLYISDKASAEQRRAVEEFVKGNWGSAFAKLETKSVPVQTKLAAEQKELTIGKVSAIKVSPLKNPDGTIPAIEHPPFAMYPKLYCAKADIHTYHDGAAEWDFSGRNAFYGPFEYTSKP